MKSWFHVFAGKYNIADRWVGLDYAQLMTKPLDAELTLYHETVHSVLAEQTDFGQATNAVFQTQEKFTHLKVNKEKIGGLLLNSQIFVQEGFATLMEVRHHKNLTNKSNALAWAEETLTDEYYRRLKELLFTLDFSKRYFDFFTSKISHLAMETAIRKFAVEQDLYSEPKKLERFLANSNNNPDIRLKKIINTLKYKNWLVTKPIPEIAKACEVTYFDSPSKQEVANYLTYVTSFTDTPHNFSPNDIGDTPHINDLLAKIHKNLIIGNMNLNFGKTAEVLFDLDDFLHYADKMEIVFVNLNDSEDKEYKNYIRLQTGYEPEVTLAGFLRTGEKYLTATSKKNAEITLNNQLKDATLFVKWGGYSIQNDRLIWSHKARIPHFVVYNTTQQLQTTIGGYLEQNIDCKIQHLHMGAMENHPLQSLIVKFNHLTPVHIVNTYGNRDILEFIRKNNDNTKIMPKEEFRSNKKHFNNLLSCWMGLDWRIDWVETMLDGKSLHYRY